MTTDNLDSFYLCIPNDNDETANNNTTTTSLEETSCCLVLASRLDRKVFQPCEQLSQLLDNLKASVFFHTTNKNCPPCGWKLHYSSCQLQATLEKDNLRLVLHNDLEWSCFYCDRQVPPQAAQAIFLVSTNHTPSSHPSRIQTVVHLVQLLRNLDSSCVACIGCNPAMYPSTWFYPQGDHLTYLTSQDGRGTILGIVDSSKSPKSVSLYAVDCHVLLVNKLGVLRCPPCRKLKITLYRRLQRQEKENQNPNLPS
jgi:hypothetical protein